MTDQEHVYTMGARAALQTAIREGVNELRLVLGMPSSGGESADSIQYQANGTWIDLILLKDRPDIGFPRPFGEALMRGFELMSGIAAPSRRELREGQFYMQSGEDGQQHHLIHISFREQSGSRTALLTIKNIDV